MNWLLKLFFITVLIFPLQAGAEIPNQIKEDFSPLAGTVIMPIDDEFLIDLDGSANLKEGDILALTTPGKKVIHPITKEVLGTLDDVQGFLRVTQVKSGYSYVQIISTQRPPMKGDQVKRFEQVPAVIDHSLSNTDLATEIKNGLPHLNWLNDQSDHNNPLLFFGLKNNKLSVEDKDGIVLRSYQYINNKLSAPPSFGIQENNFRIDGPVSQNKTLLNKTVDNLLGSIGIGNNKDQRLENPGIIQKLQKQDGDIWIGPNLDGNPVGLAINDFDADGANEIAVAMEDNVQIYRLQEGQLKKVTEIDFPDIVNLLKLESLDLTRNGYPELYLTANVGESLSSQVVEFQNGQYQRIQNKIPWFIRAMSSPDKDSGLIAQKLGNPETPFEHQFFIVNARDKKLVQGPDLPINRRLNLFSFLPFEGTGNDSLYAEISTDDYLRIVSAQGNVLWQSGEHFGGTEVYFYNVSNRFKELTKPIYIQQRLIQLPGGEILVPQNDGPRAVERFRNFTKNRIIAMKWDGFALTESWRTTDQGGYLADFSVADADNDGKDELIMVVKYKQKNLFQGGRSAIVIYELN